MSYTNNTLGTATASASFAETANYMVGQASKTFSIEYGWKGFLQPINDTAHQTGVSQSKFKLGQTIPVKFAIYNAAGTAVQQSQNPTFTRSNNLGRVTQPPRSRIRRLFRRTPPPPTHSRAASTTTTGAPRA